MKGASGEEKKKHVLAIVADGADVARAGGAKISTEEITAIASRGIDTVIETVHVVEGAKATRPGEVTAAGTTARSVAGVAGSAAGSLPGVDTAPRSSDLGGGRATHGHGSSDDPPPAPVAASNVDDGRAVDDNTNAPRTEASDGGANRPPSNTDQNG
jgi:hypothetical protein